MPISIHKLCICTSISFFICLESYNINILIMYKEVSLIPLFSCHLSNWKFIYGKFMTLLCTIPSKTVVKLTRCLFFETMHYILALLRLVSFFFFYPGWIISPSFSLKIDRQWMCLLYSYLLHVKPVEGISSPAMQQFTCISLVWMVGNR